MAIKKDTTATAIGFYLTLEDTLTPALGKAEKSYASFTKALDVANASAVRKARFGLETVANAVDSFTASMRQAHKQVANLPKAATTALKGLNKVKPVVALDFKVPQTLDLPKATVEVALKVPKVPDLTKSGSVSGGMLKTDSAKFAKEVAASVSAAVRKALGSVKITLSAAVPKKRNPAFDTSESLKEQYKNLANPVDYKGRITIPKFASGGHVGSKLQGTSGPSPVDDVLALLNKDEFVLSADMVKELEKSVGKLRSAQGQFIKFPVDVSDALANITNLERSIEKLKPVVDAGFDPAAAQDMDKAVKALNGEMGKLTTAMKGLDPRTARKLSSEFVKVKSRVDANNKALDEQNDKLDKIADASRFTALMTALNNVGGAFSQFSSSASDVFGGDQMEGFVDNMNQVNRQLGMSRSQLSEFKGEMIDVANATDGAVNFHEMGEAVEGLVQAGMKDKGALKEMAGSVSMFTKSSGYSADETAKLVYGMQRFGMTGQQTIDMLANVNNYTHTLAVNQDELMDSIKGATEAGATYLKTLKPDQVANFTNNTAMMTAALSANWAGMDGGGAAAGGFAKMMAEAAKGSTEAMNSLSALGVTQEDVQAAMTSSDPKKMQELVGKMGAKFKSLDLSVSGNAAALEAFAKASGISGESLATLIQKGPDLQDSLKKAQEATVKAGDGQKSLAQDVENTQTWWQGLKNSIVNGAAAIGGAGLVDFFKEFNPQATLSAIQLAKMSYELLASVPASLKAGAAWALNLVTFGKFSKGLDAASKAASAAGTATSAASSAAAGPVKSLGTTIKEVGQGIGSFVASLGKGLGQAIASIGAGVSAGITAMLPGLAALGTFFMTPVAWVAVAGIAALGASLIPLAYALATASPAIAAFGTVIEKSLSGVGKLISEVLGGLGNFIGNTIKPLFESIGTTISTMFRDLMSGIKDIDAGKLLALGPAFIAAGAGMVAMAFGLTTLAPALVAVGTGLALFSVVSPVGTGAGASILGAAITGLAMAFTVDPQVLGPATASVWSAVSFVTGLGTAAAALTTAGLAAGPLLLGVGVAMATLPLLTTAVSAAVYRISDSFASMPRGLSVSFAGYGETLLSLAEMVGIMGGAALALTLAGATTAPLLIGVGASLLVLPPLVKAVSSAISYIGEKFANLDKNGPVLRSSVDTLLDLTKMLGALALATTALSAVAVTGFGAKVIDTLTTFFSFGTSPLDMIREQIGNMEAIATAIIAATANLSTTLPGFQSSSSVLTNLGTVIRAYAGVASALGEIPQPGLFATAWGKIAGWFGAKSPVEQVRDQMPGIAAMASSVSSAGGPLATEAGLAQLQGTISAIKATGAFTSQLSSLIPEIAKVADLSKSLSGGTFSSSAWEKINNNLIPALTAMQGLQNAAVNPYTPAGNIRTQAQPSVTPSMISAATAATTTKDEHDAAADIPPYIVETNALLRELIRTVGDSRTVPVAAQAAPMRSPTGATRNSAAVSDIAGFKG